MSVNGSSVTQQILTELLDVLDSIDLTLKVSLVWLCITVAIVHQTNGTTVVCSS